MSDEIPLGDGPGGRDSQREGGRRTAISVSTHYPLHSRMLFPLPLQRHQVHHFMFNHEALCDNERAGNFRGKRVLGSKKMIDCQTFAILNIVAVIYFPSFLLVVIWSNYPAILGRK